MAASGCGFWVLGTESWLVMAQAWKCTLAVVLMLNLMIKLIDKECSMMGHKLDELGPVQTQP